MDHDVRQSFGSCTCPHCQVELGGAMNADGSSESPQIGDITVCAYCANYLQFAKSGFQQLTDKAAKTMLDTSMYEQIERYRAVIKRYRSIKRRV